MLFSRRKLKNSLPKFTKSGMAKTLKRIWLEPSSAWRYARFWSVEWLADCLEEAWPTSLAGRKACSTLNPWAFLVLFSPDVPNQQELTKCSLLEDSWLALHVDSSRALCLCTSRRWLRSASEAEWVPSINWPSQRAYFWAWFWGWTTSWVQLTIGQSWLVWLPFQQSCRQSCSFSCQNHHDTSFLTKKMKRPDEKRWLSSGQRLKSMKKWTKSRLRQQKMTLDLCPYGSSLRVPIWDWPCSSPFACTCRSNCPASLPSFTTLPNSLQ